MCMAHLIYTFENGEGIPYPWRAAMVRAWNIEHLRLYLTGWAYRFRYLKKDGSVRIAYGTLREDLIPAEKRPKNQPDTSKPNYGVFTYYDFESKDWRSCLVSNLNPHDFRRCRAIWIADDDQ